jgi:hypothetical protein
LTAQASSPCSPVPRRDRIVGAVTLIAILALAAVQPVWIALDPVAEAVSLRSRGSRVDPWGHQFQWHEVERIAGHSFAYSLGPNGRDDSRLHFVTMERELDDLPSVGRADWLRGDDFYVSWGHRLSYMPAPRARDLFLWGRLVPGLVLVVCVIYLAVRQGRAPVSPNIGLEFVRSTLVAASFAAAATLGVVASLGWRGPREVGEGLTIVSWPTSVFATVQLASTLGVLWWRVGRKRDTSQA